MTNLKIEKWLQTHSNINNIQPVSHHSCGHLPVKRELWVALDGRVRRIHVDVPSFTLLRSSKRDRPGIIKRTCGDGCACAKEKRKNKQNNDFRKYTQTQIKQLMGQTSS